MPRFLKEDSSIYERILKAENTLDELGIKITMSRGGHGIVITDTHNNRDFRCASDNINFSFPRDTDCRFVMLE